MLDRLRNALASVISPTPYIRHMSLAGDQISISPPKQSTAGRLLTWQTPTPTHPPANYQSFVTRGYRANAIHRRCVDMLAGNLCQGQIVIQDTKTNEFIHDHPLKRIFKLGGRWRPIPGMTEKTLWLELIQDLYLFGNGYWEKVRNHHGEVVELWRLNPQNVAVEPDPKTGVRRYLYQVGGKWWPIELENLMHWKFPDPYQPYFGIPPIYSAVRDLSVDNSLIDHLKVTLENYAIPPVVVETDQEVGTISEDDAEEFRERWYHKYGRAGKGRPAVLEPGTKIKVIGMDFEKMAIGALVSTSESRIASVHGVPMILLGRSGTQADPTRANYREAKEHFWFDTIIAVQEQAAEQVSLHILPEWDMDPVGGLVAAWDNSDVPTIQEARIRRAKEVSEIFTTGMISRHYAQRLADLEVRGPDVFYRPGSVDGVIPADAESESIDITEI